MAKDHGVNKSQAIRDTLAQHPKAKSKEIVAMLGEKGIKVQTSLVYFIKSKMKSASRKQKRVSAVEAGRKAGSGSPVQLVLEVRSLAVKAGGFRNLKQLVDILAE